MVAGIGGSSMFGLTHSATVFLTEQLFGAQSCRNYSFKYHAYERDEYDEVRTCITPIGVTSTTRCSTCYKYEYECDEGFVHILNTSKMGEAAGL